MRHFVRDDLPPGSIALLAQNWSEANAALDQLLDLNRGHRQTGCTAWYCCNPELADRLDNYEPHQVYMMLRVAMERLTKSP